MSDKQIEKLEEREKDLFLKFSNRIRSITDIRNISNKLDRIICEITSSIFTILYLYQPEKNMLIGIGPTNMSPVIRKAERFIGLVPEDLEVDLSMHDEVRKLIRRKRPFEHGELDSINLIHNLTGKTKKKVKSLVSMLKIRNCIIQPLTVVEGRMGKKTLVGILLVASQSHHLERHEKVVLSLLSDQVGLALYNELINRRLRTEMKFKESNQRLFETLNVTSLEIQKLKEQDEIYKAMATSLYKSGLGSMILLRDNHAGNITFRHYIYKRTLYSTLKKLHSINLKEFSIRLSKIPKVKELFDLKGPIFFDNIDWFKHATIKALGLEKHKKNLLNMIGVNEGIICPIMVQDRCDQLLFLQGEGLSEGDILSIEVFALHIGNALERLINEKEAKRKSQLLELANHISLNISKNLEKKKIMEIFTQNLQKSQNYLDVAIFLLDEEKDRLEKQAQSGAYIGKAPPHYSQSVGDGLFGVCLKKGHTIIVNDVSKDKRFRSRPWLRTSSEMVNPIIMDGNIIGVINVESDIKGAFSEWDRLTIETLSRNLAISLQNAHNLAEQKRRSDILYLLNGISTKALNAKNVQNLMEQVGVMIKNTFGFYNVGIFIIDRTKLPLRILNLKVNIGAYSNLASPGTEFPVNMGLVGACYTKGSTIVVNDTSLDKRYVPEPLDQTRSELCLPIKVEGETIGVLNIESHETDSFSPVEIITLETVSDILSRAIQNLDQMSQLVKDQRDVSMVIEIEKEFASHLDGMDILKTAVDLLHDRFRYYNVEYYNIDEENYDFELFAIKGGFKRSHKKWSRQNIDAGILGHAFKDKRPIMVNETSKFNRYFESIGKNVGSAIVVPITIDKTIIGILNIESNEPNAYHEWDSLILNAVGELLSRALERSNKYEGHRKREEQFKVAYDIAMGLSRCTSIKELFKKIPKSIKKHLRLYHVEVLSYDAEKDQLTIMGSAGGFKKASRPGTTFEANGGLVGWCLAEDTNDFVNDLTVDTRFIDANVSTSKSEMVVLMHDGEQIIGILDAKSKHFDAFSEWDLETMEVIIGQIENIIWHLRNVDRDPLFK